MWGTLHVPTRSSRASPNIDPVSSPSHSLMLRTCRRLPRVAHVRCYSSTAQFAPAQYLVIDDNNTIAGWSRLDKNQPAIFKQCFGNLPAISKWFLTPNPFDRLYLDNTRAWDINTLYLKPHGASIVPLELTRSYPNEPPTFERFEAPLSLLLAYMDGPAPPDLHMYLAQHSLADLPAALQADLPTPPLLNDLGSGDIYASSLWMGTSPTRTPLHRDPNPNLFVQLAGQKVVRLMRPKIGRGVYERAKLKAGGGGRANMRGEEMMVGAEMQALEEAVWNAQDEHAEGVEAELEAGDGLYIPLGWWHAVRGTGTGANASVGHHVDLG